MRIAWFSDFGSVDSQSESLSSYVSRLLLPMLMQDFDIELFSRKKGSFLGKPVQHFLGAFVRDKENPFDLFFYQFEDSKDSFFVRAHMGLEPGVVYFHDFFLTSDGPEPLLNSPWEEVAAKFNDASRPWPARGAEFARGRPQAYREAAYAFVPVFSSERDHNEYKRAIEKRCGVPGLKSWYLPVPVFGGAKPSTQTEWPRMEGPASAGPQNGPDGAGPSNILAFCGSPNIEHRAYKLLPAIKEAEGDWSLLWLVDETEKEQAASLLEEYGIKNCELLSSRNPLKWSEIIGHASACAHTLFSVYGHTNPYLPISLVSGLPCIVTDYAGSALLPDSVVFKVEPGDTEASQISQVLSAIAQGAGKGSEDLIREFGDEAFSAEKIARELAIIFHESKGVLLEGRRRWKLLKADARAALLSEVKSQDESSILESAYRELGWENATGS